MELPKILFLKKMYAYIISVFFLILIFSLIFFSISFKVVKFATIFGIIMLGLIALMNFLTINKMELMVLNKKYIDLRFKITSKKGIRIYLNEIKKINLINNKLFIKLKDLEKPVCFKLNMIKKNDSDFLLDYLKVNKIKIYKENFSK